MQLWSTNNEQRFAVRTRGSTQREIVDFEGLSLCVARWWKIKIRVFPTGVGVNRAVRRTVQQGAVFPTAVGVNRRRDA